MACVAWRGVPTNLSLPDMAKGNSVKGGMKAAKVAKRSNKGAKGGKPKNIKRRGKPEKGGKGEPGKHSNLGKSAGVPGGKQKKGKKGPRHKQLSGVAPDPLDAAAEDDSDVDESAVEGLKEYAGYSNFLLDMDEQAQGANQADETDRRTGCRSNESCGLAGAGVGIAP